MALTRSEPPSPSARLHGAGCVAGIATFHVLHLAGVHMWDRHLRELLYLKQEEKQDRGSGLADTHGLPDAQIHPRLKGCTSWLPD